MRTSEKTDIISAALSLAQGEFLPIKKKKDNPFHKSKYAGLNDVIQATRAGLINNGLSTNQPPSFKDGRVIITTRLNHKSGQFLEEDGLSIKPEKETAQAIGSAITYGRRYGLEGMLGVSSEDDDDDGNAASGKVEEKKEEPKKPVVVPEKKYSGTDEERLLLSNMLKKRGITNIEEMKRIHLSSMGKTSKEIEANLAYIGFDDL